MKKMLFLIVASLMNLLFNGCFGSCVPEFECTTATVGEKGKLWFEFEEVLGDISADSGKAFCAGTKAHMKIRYADTANSIEMDYYVVESTDEDVISIDNILGAAEYPFELGMNNEGVSQIQVTRKRDRKLIDYQRFRVAEPDGLWFYVEHPQKDNWRPEPLIISSGINYCELVFYPYELAGGEDKRELYGDWLLNVSGYDDNLNVEVGDFISSLDNTRDVVIEALSSGSWKLTFLGPKNISVIKDVIAVESNEVNSIKIAISWIWGSEINASEMYAGGSGYLYAIQSTVDGDICGGFDTVFVSSDPRIVSIDYESIFNRPNAVYFSLEAPGTAVITASLKDNPDITDSITVTVKQPPED